MRVLHYTQTHRFIFHVDPFHRGVPAYYILFASQSFLCFYLSTVISILVVITVLCVVYIVVVRWCRSKTVNKQPFYDCVAPSQPPPLPERMEVKENVSYGRLLTDTPVISQPAVYEVPQVSELQDNIELTENASYGHLLADTPQSVSAPPLQPNVAYGAIQVSRPPRLADTMNDSQST